MRLPQRTLRTIPQSVSHQFVRPAFIRIPFPSSSMPVYFIYDSAMLVWSTCSCSCSCGMIRARLGMNKASPPGTQITRGNAKPLTSHVKCASRRGQELGRLRSLATQITIEASPLRRTLLCHMSCDKEQAILDQSFQYCYPVPESGSVKLIDKKHLKLIHLSPSCPGSGQTVQHWSVVEMTQFLSTSVASLTRPFAGGAPLSHLPAESGRVLSELK